ncbi:hypothetical protein ACFQ38_05500 [Sporosarcina contaminans]|uniref:Uncharacterized protein n=1 Tax=Sporosarcina contaminans TaxID=633403 RepID=A0ABW3TUW2_9BACL
MVVDYFGVKIFSFFTILFLSQAILMIIFKQKKQTVSLIFNYILLIGINYFVFTWKDSLLDESYNYRTWLWGVLGLSYIMVAINTYLFLKSKKKKSTNTKKKNNHLLKL